jgi:hypothetical protein
MIAFRLTIPLRPHHRLLRLQEHFEESLARGGLVSKPANRPWPLGSAPIASDSSWVCAAADDTAGAEDRKAIDSRTAQMNKRQLPVPLHEQTHTG